MRRIATLIAVGGMLAACTTGGGGVPTTGGGGGMQIPADVYYINTGLNPNSVRAFSSGPVAGGGQPSELSGSPYNIVGINGNAGAPYGMTLALNGSVLYAVSTPAKNVTSFGVAANGTLSAPANFSVTGATPAGICVDPLSQFAAVVDTSGSVDVFNITAGTGALTNDVNVTLNGLNAPVDCAFSSDSKYLYVSNSALNAGISAWSVSGTPPVMTVLGGSPFNSSPTSDFQGIVATSAGILWAATRAGNGVVAFQIQPTGGLLAGAQIMGTAIGPYGVAITPNGKYLYLGAAGANSVDAYAINGTSLTRLAGAPYFTAVPSTYVSVSNAGNLLVALDPVGQGVQFFAINSNGTLSAAPTNTYVFNAAAAKPAAVVAR